jgi:hypothetical protein
MSSFHEQLYRDIYQISIMASFILASYLPILVKIVWFKPQRGGAYFRFALSVY